jgi:hypothetical protein
LFSQSGLNEITISDLTSLADPDSIRVSGTTDGHPARINDLTIDLIPNKYAHIPTFDVDSESESDDEDDEPQSLTAAREVSDAIALERQKVEERKSLANQELSYLTLYTNSLASTASNKADPATMKSALELYTAQRKAQFDAVAECDTQLDRLTKDAEKANKELQKELKKVERATLAKAEAKEKKKVEKEERMREKKENKPEKKLKVHRVRITIDLPAEGFNASEVSQEATLNLTYTTSAASWTPHYDLRLDTTNPPLSTLTYRGHFINRTFETWTNARITLSTSQALFGGLNEKIPQMEAWRVNLGKKYDYFIQNQGENGLYSLAEQRVLTPPEENVPKAEEQVRSRGGLPELYMLGGSGTRSAKKSKSMFGRGGGAAPGPGASASMSWASAGGTVSNVRRDEVEEEEDGATLAPSGNPIAHSTAGLDTYGFTTTYDLPTPRTIPSSPLVRRHVIAEVPLPSLLFTYIIIPKLKPAAFLKAKLTNTSDIPLLAGVAGLTLDGSFLGNLSFPRASPDETVVLELGVDQGLKVEYDRPTTKRSTHGMIGFGKEEVGAYKRMMRITNTKSTMVSVVVLDQVPVPEDEKLKVAILFPKGLAKEGDVVTNGVGVDGKAATRKKKPKVDQSPSTTTAVSSSKLEDIPENASTGGSVRGSTLFPKRESTLSSAPGKLTVFCKSCGS